VKRGVLLFNLGGPETLDDVRPFLYNLFSDPEIIRIKSDLLRKMLAWLIASVRQGKSRDLYRQIGGGSPLRRITEDQAAALSEVLRSRWMAANVYVGMRCWNPSIDAAVDQILKDQITHLVLLPLFPQFSVTTTGSCLKYFRSLDRKFGLAARIQISTVESWFEEPLYVEAMADLVREGLRAFSGTEGEKINLLYSAHSIPARYIDAGDPYLDQTRKSVELINSRLENKHPSVLAFQSKVGPVKWLSPATKDALVALGREGSARVLTVPVSFVSDHIETLQEIDIQYRDLAAQSGIKEFRRAASPNLYPKFINALAEIAIRSFGDTGDSHHNSQIPQM
jgi:protoporphyrin/coproporphyrin ferrochelatase